MKNQLCWFFRAAVTGGIVNSDMKIVSIPMLLGCRRQCQLQRVSMGSLWLPIIKPNNKNTLQYHNSPVCYGSRNKPKIRKIYPKAHDGKLLIFLWTQRIIFPWFWHSSKIQYSLLYFLNSRTELKSEGPKPWRRLIRRSSKVLFLTKAFF